MSWTIITTFVAFVAVATFDHSLSLVHNRCFVACCISEISSRATLYALLELCGCARNVPQAVSDLRADFKMKGAEEVNQIFSVQIQSVSAYRRHDRKSRMK